MGLLWSRFDCDWQEDPFVAPLDAAERNVVGTIYLIAARRGEPTWRPPNPAKQEVGPQPEHMSVGIDWLEPSYVARRSGADFTTAQRVLQKMRDAKKIVVEDADSALVRNVGKFNAEPLRDARRKRENKRRPSPADPHPEDRGSPGTLETPTGAVPSTPPPFPVEGRKEGRKEVTTGEGGQSLALVPMPEVPRVPGPLVPLIPESERPAHRRMGLSVVRDVHERSGIFQGLDFANSPMSALVSGWFDMGYSWAHIVSAYQEIARVMSRPNHGGIRKPSYAIEHLVTHTSHGAIMDWDSRTAGDGTAPWKPKRQALDLRAKQRELEAAEGKG